MRNDAENLGRDCPGHQGKEPSGLGGIAPETGGGKEGGGAAGGGARRKGGGLKQKKALLEMLKIVTVQNDKRRKDEVL